MTQREWYRRAFSGHYLLRVSAINLMAAVFATLLFAWFRHYTSVHDLLLTAVHSLVFSFFIGTSLSVFAPFVTIAIGRTRLAVKIAVFTSALLVCTALGCFCGAWFLAALGLLSGEFWPQFYDILRFSILIALIFGLGAFFYEHMHAQLEQTALELRTRQLAEERMLKLVAEARLSALEARIHPHFLFNTLNSIASLIPDDPRRAEDMITRLATLLRFSLDAGQTRLVPLSREIRMISDYLVIESARFGERLRYSIDVPAGLESLEVPPLSIQSLVENSVKYAIAPSRQPGEIRVAARANATHIDIEVSDSGPGFDLSQAPPGHGIDSLQARLAALYGGAARLETAGATVRISLPLAEPKG